MRKILLHVHCTDWQGQPCRRTYVISEFWPGVVDIVEESRPRCEADRTAVFETRSNEDLVFEVEVGR